MKINKSELKTIISEEVRNVMLDEGFWDTLKGGAGKIGAAIGPGLKKFGSSFMSGLMGDKPSDNIFSKGLHSMHGTMLIPKVDNLYQEISRRIAELRSHEEGKKLVNPSTSQPSSPEEAKLIYTPAESMKVLQAHQQKLADLIEHWAQMTILHREVSGGATGGEETPTEREPEQLELSPELSGKEPEQGELPLAEVIRRQVYREIQNLRERN